MYEWSLVENNIEKTRSISENIVTVSTYIKKLFLLNFEIALMIFWVFLILMVFVAIGFIFVFIFWLYVYLKRMVR
jgi:hypothetical protein